MTTIQLIYHIASNPQITNVVLKDEDDRTPMQAIECLSAELCFDGESSEWKVENWRVNTSLEKSTLLAWQ